LELTDIFMLLFVVILCFACEFPFECLTPVQAEFDTTMESGGVCGKTAFAIGIQCATIVA